MGTLKMKTFDDGQTADADFDDEHIEDEDFDDGQTEEEEFEFGDEREHLANNKYMVFETFNIRSSIFFMWRCRCS